jgi:hypothetical protein
MSIYEFKVRVRLDRIVVKVLNGLEGFVLKVFRLLVEFRTQYPYPFCHVG